MKKKAIVVEVLFVFIIFIIIVFVFKNNNEESMEKTNNSEIIDNKSNELIDNKKELSIEKGILKSIEDISLHDIDGKESNYLFTYNGVEFTVKYTKDNWKIYNSYLITNSNDMEIICNALLDIHPIHGKDKTSYRTAQDMVYEWEQHNVAYVIIPSGSKWNNMAKDVDFNPEDQGRSLEEMFDLRVKKNTQ